MVKMKKEEIKLGIAKRPLQSENFYTGQDK